MGTSPGTPPGLMSRSLHLKHTGRSPTLPPAQGSQGPPPPRASALGSSPLARGLPGVRAAGSVPVGIIPAHAGFTPPSTATTVPCRDHPRSRGVYAHRPVDGQMGRGSSPLARGLQSVTLARTTVWGIIPARAGFTVVQDHPTVGVEDHPRSRGVYTPAASATGRLPGSSPLARGLPLSSQPRTWSPGIIPARAGFTATAWMPVTRPRDHPRSRGVYVVCEGSRSWLHGSSPLARGLLLSIGLPRRISRIIPARAGFTPGSSGGRRR